MELESESDGHFDGCPLCGRPSWQHLKERAAHSQASPE